MKIIITRVEISKFVVEYNDEFANQHSDEELCRVALEESYEADAESWETEMLEKAETAY